MPNHTSPSKGNKIRKQRIATVVLGVLVLLVATILIVLGRLAVFLPLYPSLSGFPFSSKTYLVLLQNDAELRPGGGFISGVAALRFTAGVPMGISIADVYHLERSATGSSTVPQQGMDDRRGTFQDGNYDADFPANSRRLIELYALVNPGQAVDGIVAVNFSVFEDLVRIVGPLNVSGKETTADDLFPRLEHEVHDIDRHDVDQLRERKDVLRPLATQLMKKILLSPWRYPAVARIVETALERKEIQLFFISDRLQGSMQRRAWTGPLPAPGPTDFLAVVEANQGGMKADRFIERSVQYSVDLGSTVDGRLLSPTATVRIRLDHHGEYNEPLSFTYRGFMRVLAPAGSRLLHPHPEDIVTVESGYESFGREITLEPGQSTTMEFAYALPPTIVVNGRYSLHLQKQSGTEDFYSVNVHAPADSILAGHGWQGGVRVASRRAFLQHDEQLSLTITPDGIPPRIVKQVFRDLDTIELDTNEPLDELSCEEKGNFTLRDMDRKHPENTDMPRIVSIDCQERRITLGVEGISHQIEEHYQLTVRALRDVAGNLMTPLPRTYTIVQRL